MIHIFKADNQPSRGLVVWVDDEAHAILPYIRNLNSKGLDVEVYPTAKEVLWRLERETDKEHPRVIILDLWIPAGRLAEFHDELDSVPAQSMGIEVLRCLTVSGTNIPIIVVSGVLNNELHDILRTFDALVKDRIFAKPPLPSAFVSKVIETAEG